MKTFHLVLLVLGAVVAAESTSLFSRFLVVPRTVTTTVTSTSVLTVVTASTSACFSVAVNSTTNSTVTCARRRRQLPVVEEIEGSDEEIDASEPLP